jgi:two-component system response regulator PhoP
MRLLIVEDEAALREQLAQRLVGEGWQVDACGDGEEGLYLATEYPLDLAVVDLGLPGLPGLELIRRLRAQGSRLPILILTARGQWQEKVEGLEAGADDYLVKPFHPEELIARIRALTRRAAGSGSDRLSFGALVLDTNAQTVTLSGTPVALTAFEYRLLEYLARRPGEVVTKQALSDYLYPHDEDRDSNVIEVLIGRLRRKLDEDGALRPIETLRGRGYRFALSPEGA